MPKEFACIPTIPALKHFAIAHNEAGHPANFKCLPGGGNIVKRAMVSAFDFPVHEDVFTLRGYCQDANSLIGERRAKCCVHFAKALGSSKLFGSHMPDRVGRHQFINKINLTLIPNLLEPASSHSSG